MDELYRTADGIKESVIAFIHGWALRPESDDVGKPSSSDRRPDDRGALGIMNFYRLKGTKHGGDARNWRPQ